MGVFNRDLERGKEGELIVMRYMVSLGATIANVSEYAQTDFGVFMKDGAYHNFEVKHDVYAKDTGNMFVEYSCRGKASGVCSSQAEFFVTVFDCLGEMWIIKTADLRRIIIDSKLRTVVGGDKGSDTRGVLVPREPFRERFTIVKTANYKHGNIQNQTEP